jgi:hypothetical protein
MVRQTSPGEFQTIMAHGPKAELALTTAQAGMPATVAKSGNWTSGLISADGYYDMVVGVTSSQAGAINILRFADDAGTVLIESSPPTVALVAATAAALIVSDGHPFASFQIQVTNTSSSTIANLTNFAALLSAH